jgi:hypothetical protein
MNYEDRPDLLAPQDVVSAAVLARLESAVGDSGLVAAALDHDSSAASDSAPYEAMRLRARESSGPGTGAPAWALPLEFDAMSCGYRLGRLALSEWQRSRAVPLSEMRQRPESMFLYDLPLAGSAPVDEIIARHVDGATEAEEEAVLWAWAFGLGVAAVEADLSVG